MRLFLTSVLAFVLSVTVLQPTVAQTTAFTYQGYLEDSDSPLDSVVDLRFILYDSESGGSQVSDTNTRTDVEVAGGVFDVTLDFGDVFGSELRYLEVAVRIGGAEGTFSTLSPREPLRPAPFATRALALEGLTIDDQGRVGIGTNTPTSALTVDGSIEATSGGITFPDGTTQTTAGVSPSDGWQLGGNAGLDPATDYLGTSDRTSLVFAVNGTPALTIENNDVVTNSVGFLGPPNIVGGREVEVADGPIGVVVGGGWRHRVAAGDYVVIGGGRNNTITDSTFSTFVTHSTIAGGRENTIFSRESVIGGGFRNAVGGTQSVIAGGAENENTGRTSVIGGGDKNRVYPLGPDFIQGATIAGGLENEATRTGSSVGGGAVNKVFGDYGTIAGGQTNVAGNYVSIGGGSGNIAADDNVRYAVISGGFRNRATGNESSIGGGRDNSTSGIQSTVGGGNNNRARGIQGTIGGGDGNVASGDESTVGGGSDNTASSGGATVGGGLDNTASQLATTVAGGASNSATQTAAAVGGGSNNRATGSYAVVPGGRFNEARGDYSFAGGRSARVEDTHSGTFVWSDSQGSFADSLVSTGDHQFLIRARGGVGIGTNAPINTFHVSRELDGAAFARNHVAFLENTASSGGDVLALYSGAATPGGNENYITFKSATQDVGAIEGNGSGGVVYKTSGADFAEMLPLLDAGETLKAGEVVAVRGGLLTKATGGADRLLVVTDQAAVLGNAGLEETAAAVPVAFIGQVHVWVEGPVAVGDWIVASGNEDGRGRAMAPSEWDPEADGPLVGQAWAAQTGGTGRVNVAVGLDATGPLQERLMEQNDRLEGQQRHLLQQQERLDTQQQALIALQKQVRTLQGLISSGDSVTSASER